MLLCGCIKVGPDYVRPQTSVEREWLEVRDERVRTDPAQYRAWWEAFNDPVLNRIIEIAYHGNLSLKSAAVQVLEARAQLAIAVGNLYPQTQQLTGSLNFNRTSERSPLAAIGQGSRQQSGGDDKYPPTTSSNSAGGVQFSYWQDQVNFNTVWEIDFWGRYRRAIESSEATLRATLADYDNALVSLTADAANAYIQIRTLQKRLEIARQNVETQKESVQITEARFAGGVTSERDVDQAKTTMFNTLATIPTLQAQLKQQKDALCVLMGLPPSDLEDILNGDTGIPMPPPQVAVGIPADLLRRRPDVRSAELQAAAQSAQIGVAKADLLPAFSLTGNVGLLSTTAGKFSLADMFDAKAATVTAGPSFQWNVLNYGRITNNVRVQDARFEQLLISYKNTVLRAQQEVEDSLAGFLRAQENAEFLSQSTESAQRSFDLARIQYQQGITDFTTVLTAQLALLASQDNFANALGSISTNLIGIYRALGGGWLIREGQAIVPPEIKEAMEKRTNWGKLLSPAVYMPPAGDRSTVRLPDW